MRRGVLLGIGAIEKGDTSLNQYPDILKFGWYWELNRDILIIGKLNFWEEMSGRHSILVGGCHLHNLVLHEIKTGRMIM